MGTLLGLTLGLGLLLIWWSMGSPGQPPASQGRERGRQLLADAGLTGVSPWGLRWACLAAAALAFVVALVLTRTLTIPLVFGALASLLPRALVRSRARKRRLELRDAWPDAIDNLASGVRAGLSLPEAVGQLGTRGPELLRPAFGAFGEDFRATGRFALALDKLKERLADPVGDRVVETLRLAREVGGSDLGTVLRTLSAFLREDARVRGELESRQSWTVNGARMAVAAPWIVLGLMSLNPESAKAYNTRTGMVVLVVGAALCVFAYALMLRIGRLPDEQRVLR